MRRPARILVAIAIACATAVIAYATFRVVERSFFPEPNPAALIWSDRSGFAWRSLLALHAGGMGGFGGYALASWSPRASARWLGIAVTAAAIAIAAQAVIAP